MECRHSGGVEQKLLPSCARLDERHRVEFSQCGHATIRLDGHEVPGTTTVCVNVLALNLVCVYCTRARCGMYM